MSDPIAATALQRWVVSGPLLCEQFTPLPGSNKATAMDKQASAAPRWLGMTGLHGDRVADLRFHGGPDRTLCHYPTQHYAYWAQRFPHLRARLVLGAFGENLGSDDLDERELCIGDRLRWGDALIEVSQPRSPCVRLDHRYGVQGLARELSASGRVGWLYRTLEEGQVCPGDAIQLLDRPHPGISVAYVWQSVIAPALADETLLKLAELPRLATHYRNIFRQRYDTRRAQRDQRSLFD